MLEFMNRLITVYNEMDVVTYLVFFSVIATCVVVTAAQLCYLLARRLSLFLWERKIRRHNNQSRVVWNRWSE